MSRRNLILSSALVIPAAALFATFLASDGSQPEAGGLIRVPAQQARPTPIQPDAPQAAPKRLAIVASQREEDLVSTQSYAVATERRDPAWAKRSEAAIADELRRIAYIGGTRRLDIRCAATLCEVVGMAEPDAATQSYRPVWEALERDTVGTSLREQGLERVAAIFDTGRSPEEFKIQYRRVGS